MKPTLFLCTLVLACAAFVSAQQQTSPSTPPGSTPPTFPSDEGTRATPDTPAPASTQSPDAQAGSADQTKTSVEGCLSQASSGGAFTLTDSSGNTYMLQGDTSQLAKHIGEEVSLSGNMTQSSSSASTTPDSAASAPDASHAQGMSSANASKFFNVQSIKTIASTCPTGQQK